MSVGYLYFAYQYFTIAYHVHEAWLRCFLLFFECTDFWGGPDGMEVPERIPQEQQQPNEGGT